jgi:hypothetical protein
MVAQDNYCDLRGVHQIRDTETAVCFQVEVLYGSPEFFRVTAFEQVQSNAFDVPSLNARVG